MDLRSVSCEPQEGRNDYMTSIVTPAETSNSASESAQQVNEPSRRRIHRHIGPQPPSRGHNGSEPPISNTQQLSAPSRERRYPKPAPFPKKYRKYTSLTNYFLCGTIQLTQSRPFGIQLPCQSQGRDTMEKPNCLLHEGHLDPGPSWAPRQPPASPGMSAGPPIWRTTYVCSVQKKFTPNKHTPPPTRRPVPHSAAASSPNRRRRPYPPHSIDQLVNDLYLFRTKNLRQNKHSPPANAVTSPRGRK